MLELSGFDASIIISNLVTNEKFQKCKIIGHSSDTSEDY